MNGRHAPLHVLTRADRSATTARLRQTARPDQPTYEARPAPRRERGTESDDRAPDTAGDAERARPEAIPTGLAGATEPHERGFQEEILAIIGHELNTPLTVMRGALQLLERSLSGTPEQARQYAALAMEQERQIEAMVHDLVDAARLQHGQLPVDLVPLDLRDIAHQAVSGARQLARGQRISLRVPNGPVTVHGDAGRLQQALLNLLTNAIRYAPGSVQIDVSLRTVDCQAELRVQDYGPGIAEDDLPRIFTRYYRASAAMASNRDGLGLGLYLCRQLVLAHGGSIDVASTPGAGATFTVRLPLSA